MSDISIFKHGSEAFRTKVAFVLFYLFYFMLFFYPSITKRDLDKKKTLPLLQVCPESLRAILEYRYIKPDLLIQKGNEMHKGTDTAMLLKKTIKDKF